MSRLQLTSCGGGGDPGDTGESLVLSSAFAGVCCERALCWELRMPRRNGPVSAPGTLRSGGAGPPGGRSFHGQPALTSTPWKSTRDRDPVQEAGLCLGALGACLPWRGEGAGGGCGEAGSPEQTPAPQGCCH